MLYLSTILDFIICNVKIYVNGQLLYEGVPKHYEGSDYLVEYISNSMTFQSRDHSEAFDLFAVNGFIDIYVY